MWLFCKCLLLSPVLETRFDKIVVKIAIQFVITLLRKVDSSSCAPESYVFPFLYFPFVVSIQCIVLYYFIDQSLIFCIGNIFVSIEQNLKFLEIFDLTRRIACFILLICTQLFLNLINASIILISVQKYYRKFYLLHKLVSRSDD